MSSTDLRRLEWMHARLCVLEANTDTRVLGVWTVEYARGLMTPDERRLATESGAFSGMLMRLVQLSGGDRVLQISADGGMSYWITSGDIGSSWHGLDPHATRVELEVFGRSASRELFRLQLSDRYFVKFERMCD